MKGALRFGVFVPQGWKLEYDGWAAPDAWARSVELAQAAEELGYDHLWVYDHVETVPRRAPSVLFEPYTMLSALSQHTRQVELGQLVTCTSYRHPGLLAKQTACLDVYSSGRMILGIGAGWYHQEYESYGYPYRPADQRLLALDETIQAVRLLWQEDQASFDGTYVQLKEAMCSPKPLQAHPAIWVGGGGEKVTLRIAARLADATNWQVGLPSFITKSHILQGYCDEIGRPFEDITRTHGPDCRIFDSEGQALAWCHEPGGGNLWGGQDPQHYLEENLVGTVDQVVEKTQGFIDAGCREFVLWLRDYPSDETLRRYMTEVVPQLSAG